MNASRLCRLPALLLSIWALQPTGFLSAADGTWELQPGGPATSASGSWNTNTNWVDDIIADGSGFTAFFNNLNTTGTSTSSNVITLDAPRTISNLVFGDTDTSTATAWNINAGTDNPTLTMAGATPTITVNALGTNGNVRINAAISAAGLTKSGSGLLILAGANSLTGVTQVTEGTLRLLNANALGASTEVAISSGASLSIEGTSVVLTANTSGAGSISKTNNSSVLTLAGNGGHGATTLGDGAILLGTGTNNGLGTGTLTMNGGRLGSSDNAARTISNTIAMGSNGLTFGGTSGASTGLGDLTFTDAGSRTIGGNKPWTVNNDTTVTFNNTWTGNGGWNVTKNGTGTLVFKGGITTGNTVNVVVSNGTMILDGAANAYTGATTVNGGRLFINGAKNGAGAVNVNGGTFGGSGTIAGLTTVAAGATLAPGESTGADTFSLSGGLTLNATGDAILAFELGAIGASDLLLLTGGTFTGNSSGLTTVSISELDGFTTGVYTLVDWTAATATDVELGDFALASNVFTGGRTGSLQINGSQLQLNVIPEPGAAMLVLAGLGAMPWLHRRARRA